MTRIVTVTGLAVCLKAYRGLHASRPFWVRATVSRDAESNERAGGDPFDSTPVAWQIPSRTGRFG